MSEIKRTDIRKEVPKGGVLSATIMKTPARALQSARDLVGDFSGGTVVCSTRLLINQLATGLAWSLAKSVALQAQMPAQKQSEHRMKTKPIDEEADEIPTECYPFLLALQQFIGEKLDAIAIPSSKKAA